MCGYSRIPLEHDLFNFYCWMFTFKPYQSLYINIRTALLYILKYSLCLHMCLSLVQNWAAVLPLWQNAAHGMKDKQPMHTLHTNTHFHTTWTLGQNAKELEECDLVTLACRLPHGDRTLGWRASEEEARITPVSGNEREAVFVNYGHMTHTQPAVFAQVMETRAFKSSG